MYVHAFIHTQEEVKIDRVGHAEKTVLCERCQCNYGYTVYRRGVGQASYSIFGSKSKATEQATRNAAVRLKKLLQNAIEPVPCPGCGWVQSAMLRDMRRRFARWMIWAGWISLVVLLGTAGTILAITTTDGRPITFQSQRFTLDAAALGISLCIGLIGGRSGLTLLMDPNRMYGTHEVAIPGVPIGYRIGKNRLVDETNNRAWAIEAPGRVTVQLAVAQFPAYCCCCMEKTRLSQKMRCGGLAYVMLPFCKPCAARIKRITMMTYTTCATIGAAVAFGILTYLSSRDVEMIAIFTCGAAIVAGLLGLRLSRFFHSVYVSGFKRERNTARINFKNHQYAALMREEGRLV